MAINNGLIQEDEKHIFIRTSSGKILIINKATKNNFPFFHTTTEVDKQIFNLFVGMMPRKIPFIYYQWKDPVKKYEFMISSISGGLQGSVVQIAIDDSAQFDDFKVPIIDKPEKESLHAYSLPVKIGDRKNMVVERLMEYETHCEEEKQWFYDIGLMVRYDVKDRINSIHLGHYTGGTLSRDYIYGISMNDHYMECIRIWGKAIAPREIHDSYYIEKWIFKGLLISIEFWDSDADGSDPWYPDFKKDTVKSIDVFRSKKSFKFWSF
jgi:hypothetical protein